jgi:hypothetical protein
MSITRAEGEFMAVKLPVSSRRAVLKGAVGLLGLINLPHLARAASPAWADWKDLLNMLPAEPALTAARVAAGLPATNFTVQKIEAASSTKTNIDRYSVRITKLPANTTAQKLFNDMRQKLNDFFDHEASTVAGYTTADDTKWIAPGKAPFGVIMLFKIPLLGPIGEQAAVITSLAEDTRWIFTPVKIGFACPGEHPVSGNREFGWKAVGNAFEFYTRAVDRTTGICLGMGGEETTYNGGDTLWRSWQAKLVAYVTQNGGHAVANAPVIHRPTWTEVKASGLFTR